MLTCTCKTCDGTGMIDCTDCNGSGERETDLERFYIPPTHRNAQELEYLKADLIRAKAQAGKLKELRPECSSRYDADLKSTIRLIETKADKLI